MSLLVTTIEAFPSILLIRSTGVPNLRRLKYLSGMSASPPQGHKVKYPGEEGKNGGTPTSLSQVVFDRMVALSRLFPVDRVMFLNL